ncbi:hypothetical protein [Streptomyces sp. NPDC057554]|uniref:hypothetical protein n=1 Tax=Streptomyces sp. NPDC057554 TaxID=3350538 RepID=UPI00367FD8FB
MLFTEVDEIFVLARPSSGAGTGVRDDDLDATRLGVAQHPAVGMLLPCAGTGGDVVVFVDLDNVYAQPVGETAVIFLLTNDTKLTTFFVVADAEADSGR